MTRLWPLLAATALSAPGAEPVPAKPPEVSQAAIQSAFQILRSEYIRNRELTFEELNRAALQGLLGRLDLGAEMIRKSETERPTLPTGVLAEMLTPEIAYLRPLTLAEAEVAAIETKLNEYRTARIPHLILDLRTPTAPGDFAAAAGLLELFVSRGQVLFRLKQVGQDDAQLFISNREPTWTDPLIILVDEESNNLGETVAAVLRQSGQAVIVGAKTRGATVRYETLPLDDHWLLRFARAEMVLTDGTSLFKKGLSPDFPVALPAATKRQIFDIPDGVKSVREMVFDEARPRYNEAALVARKNPELESYIRQSQSDATEAAAPPPKDTVLQRAVDMLHARQHFDAFDLQWPKGSAARSTIRKAERPDTEP